MEKDIKFGNLQGERLPTELNDFSYDEYKTYNLLYYS